MTSRGDKPWQIPLELFLLARSLQSDPNEAAVFDTSPSSDIVFHVYLCVFVN